MLRGKLVKMPKNGNSIRVSGKHHSFPRFFLPLINDLEFRTDIIEVGNGPWVRKGNKNPEIKIKYYNETTQTLKLECVCPGYTQVLFLRIQSDSREKVEEYVRNYYFS